MNKIAEALKFDMALIPATINAAGNSTGDYFNLARTRRAAFIALIGAMAATATVVLQLKQAKDAAGTGAKDLKSAKTITANTKVMVATATLSAVVATNTLTVNGLVFTAVANGAAAASRQFNVGVDDTATGANIAAIINDSVYGVPDVTASAAAGVVTIQASDRGLVDVTVSGTAARFVIATVKAVAYLEILDEQLDTNGGFTHVAINVATTVSNVPVAVSLLRGGELRYSPVQIGG